MSIFEIALLVGGYNIKEARKMVESLHQLSPQEYSAYQRERLEAIVRYHRENNPVYKSLAAGVQVNRFEDLPVLTKADFQRPLESIISNGFKKGDLYIGNTSGSSGHPLSYAKNKESHALTHAIILSSLTAYGITPFSKQARFYGTPLYGMPKYMATLKDLVANRVCFPTTDLSDSKLKAFVGKFREVPFDYVYGYASAILLFARYLIRENISFQEIAPRVKCCIVSCEMCIPEEMTFLEKVLGVKVLNEYGASEVGVIAFGDERSEWRVITDDLYCETVDDNNLPVAYGEEGKLLITSLSNKAFPIIRYEIGDRGVLEMKDGKLLLKKLSGRISDLIRLPSGRIAAGETFHYIQRSMNEKAPVFREFIVRQTRLDTFQFDAVMERDLTPDEVSLLNGYMAVYLEPGLHLIINRLDRIERPDSGKLKFFYSMIN